MTDSTQAYRDSFKKELKAFLKELIKVFPDDRDIKMISSSLNIALMDDEDVTIGKIYKTLHPLDTLIHRRDPEFFVEAQKLDIDVPLFAKLNFYWTSLDNDNKKVMWDYIQLLYVLSKSIFVQKP